MVNKELFGKLAEMMRANDVEAVVVAPGNDLRFLLGGSVLLCERFQGLFIKNDATAFYYCNALYVDEISDLLGDVPVYGWHDSDGFEDGAKKLFEKYGLVGKKIAFNGNVRAFNLIKLMEAVDFTPVNGKDYLELVRIIKTPEEMDNLREASRIADLAFEGVLKFIKPGVTEKEIEDEIKRICHENGGENAGGIVPTTSETRAWSKSTPWSSWTTAAPTRECGQTLPGPSLLARPPKERSTSMTWSSRQTSPERPLT